MLYFDHNASSPLIPTAREAWLDAQQRFPGNASSPHRVGARADRALSLAREELAEWFGCDPREIIWTSGATESNNMTVAHLAAVSPGEAWVSAIEHPLKYRHRYPAADHVHRRWRCLARNSD